MCKLHKYHHVNCAVIDLICTWFQNLWNQSIVSMQSHVNITLFNEIIQHNYTLFIWWIIDIISLFPDKAKTEAITLMPSPVLMLVLFHVKWKGYISMHVVCSQFPMPQCRHTPVTKIMTSFLICEHNVNREQQQTYRNPLLTFFNKHYYNLIQEYVWDI